jgi:hypothetical protein
MTMNIVVEMPSGKRLSYRWTGDADLKVGDEVITPAPWWSSRPGYPVVAKVVALDSDYTGSLVTIDRRA